MFRKRKATNTEYGLNALARGTISFARSYVHLDRIEKELDAEIEKENAPPPREIIAKVRHHGEGLLHSKQVLLMIVLLNILDCILVLGELMLDIHYVKDLVEDSNERQLLFIQGMKSRYPTELTYIDQVDIQGLYDKLLTSSVKWNNSNIQSSMIHNRHTDLIINGTHSDAGSLQRHRRESSSVTYLTVNNSQSGGHSNSNSAHNSHGHSIEETIAHVFHKASITILAILVVETFLKVFCAGPDFFKRKLEVFDGIIIIGSFVVDLVFIKGLSVYKIEEFVFILAFLVPWRVIRVVNSLVVAVIDHQHFRLKLIYKQKKQVQYQLKESKTESKVLQNCVDALERLCKSAGIPDQKIQQHIALFQVSKTAKRGGGGVFASMFSIKKSSPGSPKVLRKALSTGSNMSLEKIRENGRNESPLPHRKNGLGSPILLHHSLSCGDDCSKCLNEIDANHVPRDEDTADEKTDLMNNKV